MENEEYYAVFQGKQTGVFRSWTEVQPLVSGFSGAVFKKFATLAEAEVYAKTGETKVERPLPVECRNSHFIYTDGAFSSKTKRCGVGVAFDAPYQACAIAKTLPTGSTHQQAEIEAIVCALLAVSQNGELKRLAHVTIWTDSDYALKCLTVWCHVWRKNGWLTTHLGPVKYRNLIEKGTKLLQALPNVKLRHISEVGLVSHAPLDQHATALTKAVWAGNRRADGLARGF